LSAIDPTGLDYVFVGGMSTSKKDEMHYKIWIYKNLDVAPGEKVVFIPDPQHSVPNVNGRAEQIADVINQEGLTNVKLIGHSEGAASVGKFARQYVEDPSIIENNLETIILINCPTGYAVDMLVGGYNTSLLYNLPIDLGKLGVKCLDIYNESDFVHGSGTLPGWENNTFNYNSSGMWRTDGSSIYSTLFWGSQVLPIIPIWLVCNNSYHNDWEHNQNVIDYMKYYIGM
jgi:hypothetical protein